MTEKQVFKTTGAAAHRSRNRPISQTSQWSCLSTLRRYGRFAAALKQKM